MGSETLLVCLNFLAHGIVHFIFITYRRIDENNTDKRINVLISILVIDSRYISNRNLHKFTVSYIH